MSNSDWLFCVAEEDGSFCFTHKDYWEREGVLDDCLDEVPGLPDGFSNSMEAMWDYYNSNIIDDAKRVQEGKRLLLEAGFTWSEDMNQFINGQ